MKSSVDNVQSKVYVQSDDLSSFYLILCPRKRETCIRIALTVTFLVISIALLNLWWYRVLYLNEKSFDVTSFFPKRNNNVALRVKGEACDYSTGAWVADQRLPLYTNNTCAYIHTQQNCMTNGRPDKEFLYWRWKPASCDLPPFDAQFFLQTMKGKNLIFIGDSIARNHMQSLLCALVQVEEPEEIYFDEETNFLFKFRSSNIMLAYRRSVFLVNFTQDGNTYNIHLDIPDVMWTNLLDSYNIAIISTGYWYFRSSVYYLNNTTVGTSSSFGLNTSVYAIYPAMQIAWDTVLRYMLKEFKGITVMRTITVPHFESSSWYNGGNCNKTQPFFDPLMKEPLPWANERMTRVQTQAFKKAMDYINENSMDPKKLLLLNITYSSFLRPDGHPGAYRIQKPDEPRNDCLHWCLPGVIDMWNEILLELLLGTSV